MPPHFSKPLFIKHFLCMTDKVGRIKKKGIKDTVLLTSELFSFKDEINDDGAVRKKLIIGTKTKQIGELKFNAHREFGNPSQIVIGKKSNNASSVEPRFSIRLK